MRTFEGAKLYLRQWNITLSKKNGEYRVNFTNGPEKTAYYTNDLEDAIQTGRAMSREGQRNPRRRRLANGYRGVVMASPGAFLLGGTTKHQSIIFHDGRQATRWTVIVAQTNKDAGRKVGDLFVQRIERGVVVETYR